MNYILMIVLMVPAIIIGSLIGTFGMWFLLKPYTKKFDKELREAHKDLVSLMSDCPVRLLNRDDLVRLFDHEYKPLDRPTFPANNCRKKQ
jgi:hypothetical protein